MDSRLAFAKGEAARAASAEGRVFDWDTAARLIRESGATEASAGLAGDWEWTGGRIFKDGRPVDEDDTCVYLLASLWATPQLELNGHVTACHVPMGTNGWTADTYWPLSARQILAEGEVIT